ncbi:MAG TPA: hypothetical protein VFA98_11645 [Thermoanaerobaculia bacterium]|nr:hypothetical protein [Thermoanaerobaculia bacterium]
MRAFIFSGAYGSSASTDTLHKRAGYGGRKGRRAKARLEARLTWNEIGDRLAQSHGVSTIYVDDRKDIVIPRDAATLPPDASTILVVPMNAEIRVVESMLLRRNR